MLDLVHQSLDIIDRFAANDQSVVLQEEHGRLGHHRLADGVGQRQAGLAIGNGHRIQAFQLPHRRCETQSADHVRERVDRVRVRDHPPRHQGVEGGLDGRANRRRGIEHGRPTGAVRALFAVDLGTRAWHAHGHEHVPVDGIGQLRARCLDPHGIIDLERGISARPLNAQRIASQDRGQSAERDGRGWRRTVPCNGRCHAAGSGGGVGRASRRGAHGAGPPRAKDIVRSLSICAFVCGALAQTSRMVLSRTPGRSRQAAGTLAEDC